jgi:molybdate transport system regulatory protein
MYRAIIGVQDRDPDPAVDSGLVEGKEFTMQLSARNQLNATVEAVNHGEVMSTVRVTLPDGQKVTAAITREAATELGFTPGDQVLVVVKATEVMLAKE